MEIPVWGIAPFVIMLLCIAVLPLVPAAAETWERNRVKLAVSLVLGVPVAIWILTMEGGGFRVAEALVEYLNFIILLFALYVVSGGLHILGDLRATPRNNTIILGVGAVLASFIGTTGAAMLLIRFLLRTNAQRTHKVHSVVFFIFIVANNGGLLTPLGDPPLYIGLLRGVPFTWTFTLFPQWLFINALLLFTYWALDRHMYFFESRDALAKDVAERRPLGMSGTINIVYMLVVIAAAAAVPSIDMEAIHAGEATWVSYVPWRVLVMLAACALSLWAAPRRPRADNQYTWGPILEVAALFIGIFLTMVPALEYLSGIAPQLPLNSTTFYLFTGGLSSVLDNAPTYATFFSMGQTLGETAPAGTELVAGVPEPYLVAISLGAVTCGAITYIGNGPNFMVKATAESGGVEMPAFAPYVGWAFRYLAPTLVAMMLLFISSPWWAKALGGLLTVALVAKSARQAGFGKHLPTADDPAQVVPGSTGSTER
jgi:Na+/H+ antiporter NhaD/arsenite permease-like protein